MSSESRPQLRSDHRLYNRGAITTRGQELIPTGVSFLTGKTLRSEFLQTYINERTVSIWGVTAKQSQDVDETELPFSRRSLCFLEGQKEGRSFAYFDS